MRPRHGIPANQNAVQLKDDSAQEILMGRINKAIEYMERKQFADAHEELDTIEAQAVNKRTGK